LLRQDVPSTANIELDLTVTDYLDEINRTVHAINDSITNTIIPYLEEINSTTHNSYDYLQNTIFPLVNSTNATVTDIKNETATLLQKWGTYNAEQLYNISNSTYNNTQQILTLIGSSSDDENQNTLFGEHAYTQNRLSSISGNLTEVQTIVTQINITTEAINSTVNNILLIVNNLTEMHQCTLSPNSTICTMLGNIYTDTQNIYTLTTEINTTISTLNLFSISALIAGSPRYANEEALIEATFTTQNGSYITPDTINITIYDPNDNIWQTATKTQFTEGSDHIWTYSKSISATPTTGMYTVHMLASYNGVEASKSAQFRIATGGPYKVYLECPATSNVGSELICNVILKDEGEAPTESTSTVWVDTNNNGVWDAGEPQSSFSKQTVPQQNVTQSVSVNVPSSHATGLYVVRVDTSYANSAQPNSGASDSVSFITAPAGDTGAGSGAGGGGITGKATEVICNPPYIRYEEGCCLDANNNSICDVDEGLPGELPEQEPETPEEQPDEEPTKEEKEKIPITMPFYLPYILIGLIVLAGLVYFAVKKKEAIKGLFRKKQKAKEKVIAYNILNTKNIIIAVLAVIVLASVLFNISIKEIPSKIINILSAVKLPSISFNWWFVLGGLVVLFLAGIFVVLILILKEIRKLTAGKRAREHSEKGKAQHKTNRRMLLIIGIIILIVLFLLMLISNPSITGNVVGVSNEGNGFWLFGFILIIGIIGLLIYSNRNKNKEIFQEVRNIEEKPIEKKTETKSLHQDKQNLQSAGFKIKPSVKERREKQSFSVSQKSPISVRLEKMQGLDKPTPDEVRTNVYKMLEENGIDVGNSLVLKKEMPQKTEQPKPEIQTKRISAPMNKQSMLNQLKGVYK